MWFLGIGIQRNPFDNPTGSKAVRINQVDFASLLKIVDNAESTLEELQSTFDKIDVREAERRVIALEGRRRNLLLQFDEAKLASIEAEITEANRDAERLWLIRKKLEQRILAVAR